MLNIKECDLSGRNRMRFVEEGCGGVVLYSEERMCIVSITIGIKKGGDNEGQRENRINK